MLKSMLLYRIIDPRHIALLNNWEELAEALAEMPAALPTGSQWLCVGFDKPAPTISDELVWSGHGGCTMSTVYFHERQLPGATIRDHLHERIRKVEDREQRKCYRKEIAQMKDDVIAMLLPKAFIKHTAVNIIVKDNLLIVGTSSAKRAEDCLSVLRSAIGSLSVRPFTPKIMPDAWLTELMQGRHADESKLTILDAARLVNSTKDTVAFKGVDLSDEEPQAYIDQGFKVAEIALALKDGDDETLFFRVTEQLIFKQIKFADFLADRVLTDANSESAALIDGNLFLFLSEVDRLIDAITELGGEDLIEHKPSKEEVDIVAEAARLITANGRVSVRMLIQNLGCDDDRAGFILHGLAEQGLVEATDDGGYRVRVEGSYESPDDAKPDGLADSTDDEQRDEFGDPIKQPAGQAEQEDDDL